MDALLSIHDVMPDTLKRVEKILSGLPGPCHENLVLLVVPGKDWSSEQLARLKGWQQSGYILAGHGWFHHAGTVSGFYHRLHSAFISRNAAEHLALTKQEIIDLIHRCHEWFATKDLYAPDYYVPPAWALGLSSEKDLSALPFRYIEKTGGIHDLSGGQYCRLPLCGFEADITFRKIFLTGWNNLQSMTSSAQRPLRISIHPDDPELLLAGQMHRFLQRVTKSRHYASLFDK